MSSSVLFKYMDRFPCFRTLVYSIWNYTSLKTPPFLSSAHTFPEISQPTVSSPSCWTIIHNRHCLVSILLFYICCLHCLHIFNLTWFDYEYIQYICNYLPGFVQNILINKDFLKKSGLWKTNFPLVTGRLNGWPELLDIQFLTKWSYSPSWIFHPLGTLITGPLGGISIPYGQWILSMALAYVPLFSLKFSFFLGGGRSMESQEKKLKR